MFLPFNGVYPFMGTIIKCSCYPECQGVKTYWRYVLNFRDFLYRIQNKNKNENLSALAYFFEIIGRKTKDFFARPNHEIEEGDCDCGSSDLLNSTARTAG